MKHSIIKQIKNICQFLFSIIYGYVISWWLLYAYAFLTDKPDRAEETADLRAAGWFMVITGIIVTISRELIMYRINRDIKKYLAYSLAPFAVTTVFLVCYIIYL